MPLETDLIKFSLAKQGRKHTGKRRNYDTAGLAKVINSPRVQERVKAGDMIGFYGHWPRLQFGMHPAEGGIVDGKPVVVQPALVTTELRAQPDGTVEHRARFLDTEAGQMAARLWQNKTGGFSGVIDTMAPNFYGFDYVMEPNFIENRGWAVALDSVTPEDLTTMLDDAVRHDYHAHIKGALVLLDSVSKSNVELMGKYAKVLEENEELRSMLATRDARDRERVTLDQAAQSWQAGQAVATAARNAETQAFARTLAEFDTAVLPRIVDPKSEERRRKFDTPDMKRLRRGLGIL